MRLLGTLSMASGEASFLQEQRRLDQRPRPGFYI